MTTDETDKPFDARQGLRDTYAAIVRQREAQALTTPQDWSHVRRIDENAQKRETRLNEAFSDEFDARVALARQTLIEKDGRNRLDHLTPDGSDRFNGDRINEQADKLVRLSHQADVDAVRESAFNAQEALRETASRRGELRGTLSRPFSRSADRRGGQDRRGPQR